MQTVREETVEYSIFGKYIAVRYYLETVCKERVRQTIHFAQDGSWGLEQWIGRRDNANDDANDDATILEKRSDSRRAEVDW